MDKNLTHIFLSTSCISEDELLLYSKNQLSEDRRRYIELHLVDCEMCADILAGMEQIEEAELDKIVLNINNKIDNRLSNYVELKQKPTKKINIYKRHLMFATAAAVLLLVGLNLYFYFQNTHSEASKNMFAKEKTVIKKDRINLEDDIIVNNQNSYFILPKLDEQEIVTKDDLSYTDEYKEEFEQMERNTLPNYAYVSEVEGIDNFISDSLTANYINLAFENYNKKNYLDAKKEMQKEITINPTNDTILFYSGMIEFQLQNFEEAQNIFNSVLSVPESEYYENALFYNALIYKFLNDTLSAIDNFKKIVKLDGHYKKEAQKELKTLKK